LIFRRKKIILSFIAILFPACCQSQVETSANDQLRSLTGEHLEYSLKYLGITAAKAQFYLNAGDSSSPSPTVEIAAQVETRPISDLLFHIHNRYSTLVNLASGLPVMAEKNIDQKNIRQNLSIEYDRRNLIARSSTASSWAITDQSLDLFSMLYHVRFLKMTFGDSAHFVLDIEGQLWRAGGAMAEGEKIPGPFQEVPVRKLVLVFSPFGEIAPRKWKTDLLTNRISRNGGMLVVCLGPPPQSLPLYLQFGQGKSAVEMKLQKVHNNQRSR
jgi:hypothetical protein